MSRKQHHRSRKWYVSTVFCRTISWGVANATVIYREYHEKFANCDAKEKLAEELACWLYPDNGDSDDNGDSAGDAVSPLVRQAHSIPPILSDSTVSVQRLQRLLPHYVGHVAANICQFCVAHLQEKKVDTFCLHCGKILCVKDGCFRNFHSLKQYLMDDLTLSHVEKRRNIHLW